MDDHSNENRSTLSTPKSADFKVWVEKLPREGVQVWREALAHVRQLHADIWQGVRFVLTVNGILIAAEVAILTKVEGQNVILFGAISLLGILGFTFTCVALGILSRHRKGYIEMLLLKTLLEHELGFYDQRLAGKDFSFPWKVDFEFLECLLRNPDRWLKEHKWRRHTIARTLRFTYCSIGVIHVLIFLTALYLTNHKLGSPREEPEQITETLERVRSGDTTMPFPNSGNETF